VSEGIDLPHVRPLGVGPRRHWRGQLPGSYGSKRFGVKVWPHRSPLAGHPAPARATQMIMGMRAASIARYVKRRAGRDGQTWAGGALSDQDVRRTGRAAPVFLAACAGSVADHSSGSGPAGSHVPHGTAAHTGLTARLCSLAGWP